MYSEQDLKHAAEFREEIHREALAKVRAVYPDADHVIDRYPADAYFQEVWDYPGKWYTMVATPPGAGSRKDLVGAIVRETLECYRTSGKTYTDDAFYRLIEEYPDVVCDYCLINAADRYAQTDGVFPYRGVDSHRLALGCAVRRLFDDGREWSYDLRRARCRKLKSKALFASANADEWLNYRKAFLCPTYGNPYTDDDFERINAVLFPAGADGLEVYRWTTDWSEYFEEGNEHGGALCLTVYDRSLDRFVVIMASPAD
ncbi:MAG: hypothetical protein IJG50_04095 [Clostridia bacterium]|nr:hypothetical protein [Clostridia bacterium]